ncbi:MAG TPA: class I SAM-dependent methyltransferase [Pseudolabrys sp.]|nr:class I SAM-dependent methyltransferase [Pseudolabrys sp.]
MRVHAAGRKVGALGPCPMCGGTAMAVHFTYSEPPPLETRFPLAKDERYWRELHRCSDCGHYVESFAPDQGSLYAGEYVTTLYRDRDGIRRAFERINALPPEKSDNVGRVRFVDSYCRDRWRGARAGVLRLLDVGAGLGVFPFRMKQAGWDCVALDMDERLAAHHRETVGVQALTGDVRGIRGIGAFDLVTFNKVLEHVGEPVGMLASVRRLLAPDGLVYVELPDGEAAAAEGKEREEFLLGHKHVFSLASYALLIAKAGFELLTCERLREPSTKFTLRGFARVGGEGSR